MKIDLIFLLSSRCRVKHLCLVLTSIVCPNELCLSSHICLGNYIGGFSINTCCYQKRGTTLQCNFSHILILKTLTKVI